MNSHDVLKYGHSFFLSSVQMVPREHVGDPGACGWWSVKDLVAHITSFELMLVEILENLASPRPTPLVEEHNASPQAFNDNQVARRQGLGLQSALEEYQQAYEWVMKASNLPMEVWRKTGILPWYGAEYDLEDYVAYSFYGHKREHGGQIQVFRDRFTA